MNSTLTLTQAARLASLTRHGLHRHIKLGRLAAHKPKNSRLAIRIEDFEAFLIDYRAGKYHSGRKPYGKRNDEQPIAI